MLLGLVGASRSAWAATPPANTNITNVATASYTDGAGTQQTALSNPVQTVIQQVGAFALTPPTPGTTTPLAGYTKSAAPGSTVYTQYTITNTGNGTDQFTIATTDKLNTGTFAAMSVFADVNQDGQPDSTTPVSAAVSIAAGGSYTFVVGYTVPASASAGWTDQADVKVTAGGLAASPSYTTAALTRTDTINATTSAAFSTNTSISLPAYGAQSYWTGGTSAAAPSSGQTGGTSIYTITYTNNGGTAGPVYIKDVLPAGFTYVAGSGSWSGAIGTALTDAAGGDSAGIDYQSVAGTVQAVVQNVAPGQSGTISFQVTIAGSAVVGTSTTNNQAAATVGAAATGAACVLPTTNFTVANCGTSATQSTNAAPYTVLSTKAVVMSATGTSVTGKDASAIVAGNAAGDAAGGVDTRTIASGAPGAALKYNFNVFNTGNDTDTFRLSLNSVAATNTFPVGTAFTWLASDGLTPLQNTSGGTGVDTGPIAAGASLGVVLQVVVPASATAPAGPFTATAQATSVGDTSKEDGAIAKLTLLNGGVVDLTQVGTAGLDVGPGTATVVQVIPVTAGGAGVNITTGASTAGSALFKLIVTNNDTGALTFGLSTSTTSSFPGNLPAGWTVSYWTDNTATTPLATAPNTASIAGSLPGPVGVATVWAKVTPPANASAGTYDLYFQAMSTGNSATTGGKVSDYLHDQVTVVAANAFGMSLASSGALQSAAGGSATYAHTLSNTGSSTCGLGTPLTLTVTGLPAGWTYSAYLDTGTLGVIDGESPLVGTGANGTSPYTIGTVLTAANKPVLLRVFPPAGAAVGTVGIATVTVTDSSAGSNCGTVVVSDTTTVTGTGQLQVSKLQKTTVGACAAWTTVASDPTSAATITSAKPGDCLMYLVTATNAGTTTATNVKISDLIPTYTTGAATQPSGALTPACSSAGASAMSITGTVAGSAAGTTFSCGTEASLNPGQVVTLRFAVQINP